MGARHDRLSPPILGKTVARATQALFELALEAAPRRLPVVGKGEYDGCARHLGPVERNRLPGAVGPLRLEPSLSGGDGHLGPVGTTSPGDELDRLGDDRTQDVAIVLRRR